MRYETPFASVAYTVNTSLPIEGDYITSATPQWSSGSLLLHDTYELDVVSAINSVDTKLTEPGARLFDQTVRLQVKRMCKHTALCYDPAVQVIV